MVSHGEGAWSYERQHALISVWNQACDVNIVRRAYINIEGKPNYNGQNGDYQKRVNAPCEMRVELTLPDSERGEATSGQILQSFSSQKLEALRGICSLHNSQVYVRGLS